MTDPKFSPSAVGAENDVPFRVGDIAPLVAQRAAENDAHRETCTLATCHLCGRRAARSARDESAERGRSLERVLAWVPTAYVSAELDADWLATLVGPDAIGRARAATAVPRVVFIGPPGSGKTSLAAAMYRAAARQEPAPRVLGAYRWVSAHQLAKARAGHPLGSGEAPLVDAAMRAPLLVLDELGGEDPRHASAVAEVLYERHAEERATWVTTGVGSKEIAARYGGGIARRIFEGSVVFRLGVKS